MEDYIKRMNEEYIKKNYPERSVFKAYKKSMGSRGRTGCIIMGLFMAGGLAGLIWSVRKTLEFMQSGDDETPLFFGGTTQISVYPKYRVQPAAEFQDIG